MKENVVDQKGYISPFLSTLMSSKINLSTLIFLGFNQEEIEESKNNINFDYDNCFKMIEEKRKYFEAEPLKGVITIRKPKKKNI